MSYTLTWPRHVLMRRVQPDDLNWTSAQFVSYIEELAVELYVQGRSVTEVADVMGLPRRDVGRLVGAASVRRKERYAYDLAVERSIAIATLNQTDIGILALWWMDGADAEVLAWALNVPRDLMLEAILEEVAKKPQFTTSAKCVRTRCTNACATTCALSGPPDTAE